MNRLFAVAAIMIFCLFAADLAGQGIGRNARKNHNTYKKASEKTAKNQQAAQKKAAKNAQRENAKDEAEAAREERDAEREAEKAERDAARAGEDSPAPEEEAEDAVPGEVLPRVVKDAAIDDAMDELKLTDASKRAAFKRNVRGAWEDSEKEDKRYHGAVTKADSNAERLAEEKKVHGEKLKKIWDESDEKLTKDAVLTDEQMEAWKKLSQDLRTKTNTDIHHDFKSKQAEPEAAEKKQAKKADKED